MEHDLVCHDIGSMGSMGSVSSMALGISSSKCSMMFSFVGPKVCSIRPSQADMSSATAIVRFIITHLVNRRSLRKQQQC
jgi:hypothetical protein